MATNYTKARTDAARPPREKIERGRAAALGDTSDRAPTDILAGTAAGVVAGLVMAGVAIARSVLAGDGFWHPVEVIAAVFHGAEALEGGAAVWLTGLVVHVLMAAALGTAFALIVGGRVTQSAAAVFGAIFAAAVFALNYFLVLPFINPVMHEAWVANTGWWFLYHLVFGVTLGLTPRFADQFRAEPDRRNRSMRPPGT